MDISAVFLSRRFLLPTPYFRTFPGRNWVWPISPCMAPTEPALSAPLSTSLSAAMACGVKNSGRRQS